jgi:hypothetical protein
MLHISRTARLIRNAKMKNYECGDKKSYKTQIKHNMLRPRMRTAEYIMNNNWMKELTKKYIYFSKTIV